jgi:hypothetical protein
MLQTLIHITLSINIQPEYKLHTNSLLKMHVIKGSRDERQGGYSYSLWRQVGLKDRRGNKQNL